MIIIHKVLATIVLFISSNRTICSYKYLLPPVHKYKQKCIKKATLCLSTKKYSCFYLDTIISITLLLVPIIFSFSPVKDCSLTHTYVYSQKFILTS